MTLYRRLLGDRFTELHPCLQDFHGNPTGGSGHGQFRVRHPAGWLTGRLAALLGLPPAGNQVPLSLRVRTDGDAERWVRRFGTHSLCSVQWQQGGLLVERAGAIRFGLEVSLAGAGMRFRTRRVWFLGVPLLRVLAPSVEADVVPDEQGWTIRVEVRLPLLGPLLQYEGHVTPL